MKKITLKNKILLLCSFLFILISTFTISSFAYHEDDNGNLVSDNLINNSTENFELGAVSYNIGKTYSENKVSSNSRIRIKGLFDVDDTKTYSLSVPEPYLVIAQGYNNGLNVSATGTQFNQALSSLSFTGVSQVAIIVRKADNSNFSSINNISNINLMFNEGNVKSFEPYGDTYYSQNNYDNAYKNGYDNATYNSFKSIMYYANFEEIYLKYESNSNILNYLGIVYGGRFCDSESNTLAGLWNNLDYQFPITNNWEKNISSSYGLFYMTPYTIYNFIEDYGTIPTINPNSQSLMYMKFITPQNLFNTNFKLSSWQRVRFIDIYGKVTDFTTTQGVFSVELYNISEILLFGSGDFVDDNYYLVSDPSSASFNNGYDLGFNDGLQINTDKISELNSQIASLQNTISTLQGQIKNMENSTSNYQHLLWTIAGTPWESFNKIWNVSFGGINIANVVTGLVTALLVIYLIKKIWK